jgi:bifunctional UDP-N-acetylglucosamine pyrophosphorylase/glucosamine-1-phosphate N-acetyltransferase
LPLVGRKNKQGEFYLTDTVDILVKKGYIVRALCCSEKEEVYGISSRKDLAYVQSIMNKRILDMHMDNGVTIVDPANTHIDIRAKIGKDTVINPFTVIDGDVTIKSHCEVGPFTHLRDKTFLEDKAEIGNFVEVKKTRVGSHTKAKHLTYLGDTVIGKNANIGAGTITANYDGKNKYQTTIKDKAFIGSGTILVAPVSVGKHSVTGAGSVVVRNKNVPDNTVVVGVPAKILKKIITNDK